MKTTIALAFLAAAALQALGAPTLRGGVEPYDELPASNDREKKSYYGGAPTPCAAASAGHLGAGVGGYGANIGVSPLIHGGAAPLLPSFHGPQISYGGYGAQQSLGYGAQPSLGYGVQSSLSYGAPHYRASEEEAQELQQGASDNHEQVAQAEPAEKAQLASEHALARSGYEGGYGGSYGGGYGPSYGPSYGGAYGPSYGGGYGGYGSGLSFGGGSPFVRPLGLGLGGPSVGVFPGGSLGGCGAIPLMLSCSPNVVQGHLVPAPHRHQYSGGYGGYGAASAGHGLYRASDASELMAHEKAAAEQKAAEQAHQAGQLGAHQAGTQPAAHQAAQGAAPSHSTAQQNQQAHSGAHSAQAENPKA